MHRKFTFVVFAKIKILDLKCNKYSDKYPGTEALFLICKYEFSLEMQACEIELLTTETKEINSCSHANTCREYWPLLHVW
jgi:hypothetical protein